ncbi:CFEM domain-containing protein [Neofusicoccum parvum]|nr:CFEM domain-containing protein [Neofusicoccum parvum]
MGGDFGWDDAVMLMTLLTMIPLSSLSVVLAEAGLGKDMWTVTPKDITHILYIYYFDESLYITSLSLVKISICCFYLRIFPSQRFRIIVYLVIFCCAAYAITFVTAVSLQCKPINLAWKHWDGEHEGKCISMNALGWSSAAMNIVLDLVVITLPVPQVWKLVLSARKKIHVMCMFSVGLFVTIVSMLRLKWMIQFANSQNITWDYVPIGYWSTIEVHAGILCACLPAMRALLYKCCPALAGSRGGKTYGPQSGGSCCYGHGTAGSRGGIDANTSIVQRVSKADDAFVGGGKSAEWDRSGEWVQLDEVDSLEAGKPGLAVSTRCYHAM